MGWANLTFPFARLHTEASALRLDAAFLGSFRLVPEEVLALEPVRWFPILAWGIRIRHVRTDLPPRIIFWHMSPPSRVLRGVAESGFEARATAPAQPLPSGSPLRTGPLVALAVVWNALLVSDFAQGFPLERGPGPATFLALLIVFAACVAVQMPGPLQRWALEPGRRIEPVLPVLRLTAFVTATMALLASLFASVS